MNKCLVYFFILVAVASTNAKSVDERQATVLDTLAQQATTSPEALVRYFRIHYGSDITQLYSYKHIKKSLFGYRHSGNKRLKEAIARDDRLKEALTVITTGPFAVALAKEAQLSSDNYAVFYHGQKQQWAFQEDFTTALINELAKRGLCEALRKDFLYIQNAPNILHENSGKPPQVYFHVNISLLGNICYPGRCSWMYALDDQNACGAELNISGDIFQAFGISKLAEAYQNKVLDLHNSLATIKTGGRLLQIAIPKYNVQEKLLTNGDRYFEYRGEDNTETSIYLCNDYFLNPNSTVKIYAYDAFEHDEEYQEWCVKRDQLIVEMVDAIQERNLSVCDSLS